MAPEMNTETDLAFAPPPLPDEPFIKPVPRIQRTLREIAAEHLREAILRLELRPGDRLVERTLCEKLNVSRSIIREVLRELEGEGLVSKDNRGPIVRQPTREELEQIYELRALLEGTAAAHCASRASTTQIKELSKFLKNIEISYKKQNFISVIEQTDSFYRQMFLAAQCDVAWELVQKLKGRISVYRAITIASADRQTTGLAEMHAILEAIKNKDAAAASLASSRHVQSAGRIALSRLGPSSPPANKKNP